MLEQSLKLLTAGARFPIIWSSPFDVANVGDYTYFTGTFHSASDVQTHDVTVPYKFRASPSTPPSWDLGGWDLKRSDSNTVYSGYRLSTVSVPYDWSGDQHLKLSGDWEFRFLSGSGKPVTIRPEVQFTFFYEIGD